ncbi:hypothetical protein [Nocardia sp. NRRL S-836]|uniref:hypothetical protein n=1 Tax=Nocardia sp. NRRL S-836 TaxID=1519492 RepID=UPI0006AF05E9|nr:hypothetical protein [Nocardia sp. NRRL S-836]KOV76939.1 hypothetical protein ADL03_42715 [Nocardia sp. NRRL S-836]
MSDDNWHNRAEKSGQTIQGRDIHGGVTVNANRTVNTNRNVARLVVVGGVLVLVGVAVTAFVLKPHDSHGPQAAAPSSSAPPAALRLAGAVQLDRSPFDKVIPSTDLAYQEVVDNFSDSEWLAAHGAVGVDEARWSFGLDGMLDHTVQLTDARPVDVECGEPLGGTYLSDPSAGTAPERLEVDFDDRNPRFLLSLPDRNQPPVPLFERKVDLHRDSTTPFLLTARSTRQHCRFKVRFDYTADGEQRQFVLDNAGRPFEVTGKASPEKYDAAYLSGLARCEVSYKVPYSQIGTGKPC